jgi:tetratricopeptide (TPR) repeat protein
MARDHLVDQVGEPRQLALAEALDDWAAIRRDRRRDPAGATRLGEAARFADPDPWRNNLRAALDRGTAARLNELMALEKEAKVDELGPISLHLLGAGLLAAGDGALAESVMRRAQQRYPDDVWLNYSLARVLEKLGRHDEAIRFYTAARAIRPETAHELAHVLQERGDSDEALGVFRDLKRLQPGNATNLLCLLDALKGKGSIEEIAETKNAALVASREEIRRSPDRGIPRANLAGALANQGKLDEAIAEYRAAIRLEPELFGVRGNLAAVLEQRGKLDEAVAEYRTMIRLAPDDPASHVNLGALLCDKLEDYPAAAGEFRKAIRLRPDHGDTYASLGKALLFQGKADEALAALRDAVRLQPSHDNAHNNLGNALEILGRPDEAIAEYRESIRLRPDIAGVHANLASGLAARGRPDEAIAEYRAAIRLEPGLAAAHHNLGTLLCDHLKQYPAAESAFREAIRLDPADAQAHTNLGNAMSKQGKLDEAIAEYRAATRLKPGDAHAHYCLANALEEQGKLDEAIAAFRAAIRLKPDHAEAHCNLGGVLERQGDYAGALAMYRKGHELGSRRPDWRYPSAQWVASVERKLTLANRLPAILRGEEKPGGNGERLSFAELAHNGKHHAAAVRLWAAALESDPKLGDDRQAAHRFNAACAAAMAAAGNGRYDPPLDEPAKAKFRRQALDWLKAELAAWGRFLEAGQPGAPSAILGKVGGWKQDADLAGIRDRDALAKLPEAERREWQALWADVDSLLKVAARSEATPSKPGPRGQAPQVETRADAKPAGARPKASPAEPPMRDKEPAAPVPLSDLHKRAHALEGSNPREAEPLFRQALEGYREMQGPDGALTFDLTMDLARLLDRTGRGAEAEPLLRDTLERILKQSGPDDPRVAPTSGSLGKSLIQQGKWSASEPLLRDALDRTRKQFGPEDHARAAGLLAPLSLSLIQQGKWSAAELVLRDALEGTRKQFGPDDPRNAGPLGSLGLTLIRQGKWSEAEPVLRECLAMREKSEPDEWSTFNTRSALGGSLMGQKKYAEAEPLIISGYEGMKAREAKIPPLGKPRFTDAAERVVKLYEAWGKKDEAARWRAKLARPSSEPRPKP